MFIVFEGLDGSGTTTQAALLADALRARGVRVRSTCEPSTGPVGAMIRQALGRRVVRAGGEALTAETLALLFAADRLDHVASVVRPALDDGCVVVSDRYVHSSLAYQGPQTGLPWVAAVNERALAPDLVLFLDVPVDLCMDRIAARGGTRDLYEERDRQVAFHSGYEAALRERPAGVVRLDGTGTIEAVHARALACALSRLGVAPASGA